jgi:hypothetical protein
MQPSLSHFSFSFADKYNIRRVIRVFIEQWV